MTLFGKYIYGEKKFNIQLYQTFFLSIVLLLGIYVFDLSIHIGEVGIIFSTVVILDTFITYLKTDKIIFPYSGLNAGFGISFFLRTDETIIFLFAAILAIVGKHILRISGRHFLNPSNMAVFLSLIIFGDLTWTNTLQWTGYSGNHDRLYYYIFLLCFFVFGLIVTLRVYKTYGFNYFIDYTFPFIIAHLVLFHLIPFGETSGSLLLFFSITFFIFTFHMISDPKTVPEKSESRFIFAILIALNFYALQFFINEMYALLGSLFVATLFLPITWYLEKRDSHLPLHLFFLIFLSIISSFVIIFGLLKFGQPDLIFNNNCIQLFCK